MEPENILKHLKNLEHEISAWPSISIHPHRFGGREFRFGSAGVGHVHAGGIVDIPFPRPVRDALLADGLAEEHHWVPNSGWITFRVRSAEEVKHALWLMRLSYLRYLLKTATDPRNLFDQESEELHWSPQFKSLLEPFVPKPQKMFRLSRSRRRRQRKLQINRSGRVNLAEGPGDLHKTLCGGAKLGQSACCLVRIRWIPKGA